MDANLNIEEIKLKQDERIDMEVNELVIFVLQFSYGTAACIKAGRPQIANRAGHRVGGAATCKRWMARVL